MMEFVAELPVDAAEHVFALRHGARVAAAAIGCDEADQVRFATALSELGREALAGKPLTRIDAARKLVGTVRVIDRNDADTVSLTIRRAVFTTKPVASAASLRAVSNALATPLDDLRF